MTNDGTVEGFIAGSGGAAGCVAALYISDVLGVASFAPSLEWAGSLVAITLMAAGCGGFLGAFVGRGLHLLKMDSFASALGLVVVPGLGWLVVQALSEGQIPSYQMGILLVTFGVFGAASGSLYQRLAIADTSHRL